jgi:hypothetical protein
MNKTVRFTLATLALVAASGAAQAGVIADWGAINAPGQTFSLSHSFSSAVNNFEDDYLFSLAGSGSASGDVDTFDGFLNLLDIDLDSVKLFKNGSLVATDTTFSNGFSFSGLGVGSYVLRITGDVTKEWGLWPTNVGYEGDVTIRTSASAVPEPATFALLGAGLAAIGVMRRRKVTG